MPITKEEFQKEEKILKKVTKLLTNTLETLGEGVIQDESNLKEFKKMMWEDASSFDDAERVQVMYATAQEAEKAYQKEKYFKRLCMIKNKPYFASIVFKKNQDKFIYYA